MSIIHPMSAYIDRAIRTNGIIRNAEGEMQTWDGYRVFIRCSLDDYDSVEDWTKHNGTWKDNSEDRYRHYQEYVIRGFPRGYGDIVDAQFVSLDCVSDLLDDSNTCRIVEFDNRLKIIMDMHIKSHNLPPLVYTDDDEFLDADDFLDTTSELAMIETKRIELNRQDFYGSI